MDVVDDDAGAVRRHREPVLAAQRALGVFVAALPMLAHRGAGEFVVLGVPFIGFLLIDQLQDRDIRQVRQLVAELALLIAISWSSGTFSSA